MTTPRKRLGKRQLVDLGFPRYFNLSCSMRREFGPDFEETPGPLDPLRRDALWPDGWQGRRDAFETFRKEILAIDNQNYIPLGCVYDYLAPETCPGSCDIPSLLPEYDVCARCPSCPGGQAPRTSASATRHQEYRQWREGLSLASDASAEAQEWLSPHDPTAPARYVAASRRRMDDRHRDVTRA